MTHTIVTERQLLDAGISKLDIIRMTDQRSTGVERLHWRDCVELGLYTFGYRNANMPSASTTFYRISTEG